MSFHLPTFRPQDDSTLNNRNQITGTGKNKADPVPVGATTEFANLNETLNELYKALDTLTPAQREELSTQIGDSLHATDIDDDEQDDTENILTKNYPNDPLLRELEDNLNASLTQSKKEMIPWEFNKFITIILETLKSGNQAVVTAVLPDTKTIENLENVQNNHIELINTIDQLVTNWLPKHQSFEPELSKLLQKAKEFLQYQSNLIDIKCEQIENYLSPHSLEKLLQQREFFNQITFRAYQIINEEVQSIKPPDGHIEGGLKAMQQHAEKRIKNRSELINTVNSKSFETTLEDEKSKGMEILRDFLEPFDLSSQISLEKIWNEARAEVLEKGRDWKIIQSEFVIHAQSPLQINDGIQADRPKVLIEHKINTTTTPIGHILNQQNIAIDSDNSPLSKNECKQYKIRSITTYNEITAGRHSHATTEHLHAVNAATTECKVNGKVVFKATRHATISPYHLTREALEEMSPEKQEEICSDLTQKRPGITNIVSQENKPSSNTVNLNSKTTASTTSEPKKTDLEEKIAAKTERYQSREIPNLVKTDPELFTLMRRRAGLNRAREVFVSSIMGDPVLLARAKAGNTIFFNSISLLTPSPAAQFLHKLKIFFGMNTRSAASRDELTMTEDQIQAWNDLQDEIDKGRIAVDGIPVTAEINAFTFGVNTVAVGIATERITGFLGYLERIEIGPIPMLVRKLKEYISKHDDFLSGWETIKSRNLESLTHMLGNLDSPSQNSPPAALKIDEDCQLGRYIKELEAKISSTNNESEITQLRREIATMKMIFSQLRGMWQAEAYRKKHISPYEFVSRLAVVSSRMEAGTGYNCKSGKDRTAHLNVDAEFLAFQIEINNGNVPHWNAKYSVDVRAQFAHFIFHDESRRTMQEYNTGVGGTKFNEKFDLVFNKFLVPEEDAEERKLIKDEFIGLAHLTKS